MIHFAVSVKDLVFNGWFGASLLLLEQSPVLHFTKLMRSVLWPYSGVAMYEDRDRCLFCRVPMMAFWLLIATMFSILFNYFGLHQRNNDIPSLTNL